MFSSYSSDVLTWDRNCPVDCAHMRKGQATNPIAGNSALLICPDAGMMAELTPLLNHHLAGVRIEPVKEYPSPETLAELISRETPRLCFLDVRSSTERALGLVGDLAILGASIQIVVLLDTNSPDLILRCLRQGAAEFLIQPFTADDLKPVLARLSQLAPSISYGHGGKIICLAPAKGACGASTLAANLACHKKSLGADRLLLADLDPLTGTISFLLKLKSSYSFLDALNLSASLDGDLWRGVVSTANGIDVLLAPENPIEMMHELPDPTPLLEFARQLYDVLIVDSPGLFDEWGLALARVCNELLLVTTNELPALQATQRALAHLDRNRVERSKVRLLVNRYTKDAGLSKDAIATALHIDVFQLIPDDTESVQRALVEGKPIPPGSAFGKALQTLPRRLSCAKPATGAKAKPAANGKDPRKKRALGGILSLFSKVTL